MELDGFLHQVQGMLKNKENVYGDLSLLTKENEERITNLVHSLSKIIPQDDIDEKKHQKLYTLLFLNLDSDVYTDLKKHRKYTHLVGFFPKLSQDIFIRMVLELELEQYFYASILHFSSSLSYQVINISNHALTWINLIKSVEFVQNVLTHLFKKIIITEETDPYCSHLKESFQQVLLYYDPESGGSIKRMRKWDKNKMKHYAGLVLASLISLLDNCTNIYCQKDNELSAKDYSILKIHLEEDACSFKPLEKSNPLSLTVQQCYDHVMAKCLDNVCETDIDIWLFWVEIELDEEPDTENTLQRYIGEKAYTCRETLKEAESLGVSLKQTSNMISKLKNISIKPQIKDKPVDLEEVITNIQDPNKNKTQWVRYLAINKLFASKIPAMEIIRDNIPLLQPNEIIKWADFILPFMKGNPDCESHKCLFFDIVKALDIDTQVEVTKSFVGVFGFSDKLKRGYFQTMLTEIFNKVINEEEKEKQLYPQFIHLALQCPKSVIQRAVAEGITSEVRGHLMADILGKLKAFCDEGKKFHKTFLIIALNKLLLSLPDLPENQQHNFPLFVRELVMRKILDGKLFIKSSIMAQLHVCLRAENWAVVIVSLETLSELFDVNCTHSIPAGIFMLMQVLDAYRWNPVNFTKHSVLVCMLTLQLIRQLVSKWHHVGYTEEERICLVDMMEKHTNLINRYHLYRLLPEEQMPSDPGMQLIYRMHYGIGLWSILQVPDESRTQLVYSLCFVLPVLTEIEWNELFCVVAPKCSEFISLFNIVMDSLILCLGSAKINCHLAVMECLVFAVINLSKCVEVELNQWNENDNEYRIMVLKRLCQLISYFPPVHQKTSLSNIVNVLEKLLPIDSRRAPLSSEEVLCVTASLASLQCDSMRQSLANIFLQMIHR